MTNPTLQTAPVNKPIDSTSAKRHLNIVSTTQDTLIGELVDAAIAVLDGQNGILGRALISQTWDYDLPCFKNVIPLPLPPIQSITSFQYLDSDGVLTPVPAATYDFDSKLGEIRLAYNQTWPTIRSQKDAVRVRYVAGYGDDAADVPADLKAALHMLTRYLFDNRDVVAIAGTSGQVGKLPEALKFSIYAITDKYKTDWVS